MWPRRGISLAAPLALTACLATEADVPPPLVTVPEGAQFAEIETRLFEDSLVQFHAGVSDVDDPEIARQLASDHAECAAAQYTLIRGYGFARHVRTNVYKEGGLWRADAVYTISPALPRGLRTLDAEVVTAACREKRIPTV